MTNTSNTTRRDELALDIFLADNFNGPNDVLAGDWATLVQEEADSNYAHRIADGLIAKGYTKPRTITTAKELDAAIVRAFEEAQNLVLFDGWRPWIIWENDMGDIRVSSLPVEDDPAHLELSDITLPATVLYAPESAA